MVPPHNRVIEEICNSEYRSPANLENGIFPFKERTECWPSSSRCSHVPSVPSGGTATDGTHPNGEPNFLAFPPHSKANPLSYFSLRLFVLVPLLLYGFTSLNRFSYRFDRPSIQDNPALKKYHSTPIEHERPFLMKPTAIPFNRIFCEVIA